MLKNYSFNNYLNTFPSRQSFIDKKKRDEIKVNIFNKLPINIFPNDIKDINLSDDGKYGIQKYKICIFGVMQDMSKIVVIIDNIEPYFDIKLIALTFEEANTEALNIFNIIKKELIENNGTRKVSYSEEVIKFEIFKSKYFKSFTIDSNYFARYYFLKNSHRCDIISIMHSKYGKETAEDDNKKNNYYRVFSRLHDIKFGEWISLKNYSYFEQMQDFKIPVFRVKYNNMTNINIITKKVLCLYWDIETYNSESKLPDYNRNNDKIFMISSVCVWSDENKPLLKVCFVDKPSSFHDEFITIYCETEINLIRGFVHLISIMMPEFVIGFNDSMYDWKWVVYRSYLKYKGIIENFEKRCSIYLPSKFGNENNSEQKILNQNFKTIFVDKSLKFDNKIDKPKGMDMLTFDMNIEIGNPRSLSFDGFISFDLRTSLRKLHKDHEKSSLNYYLALYKLGSKNDMPIKKLFQIYTDISNIDDESKMNDNESKFNTLKDEMREIAYYCVIDSFKCHELVKKTNLLLNGWENANLGYASFKDTIYEEGGIRIRNAIMRQNKLYGIEGSNATFDYIRKSEKKYPGAHVFPPVKGLICAKLSIDERILRAKEMN